MTRCHIALHHFSSRSKEMYHLVEKWDTHQDFRYIFILEKVLHSLGSRTSIIVSLFPIKKKKKSIDSGWPWRLFVIVTPDPGSWCSRFVVLATYLGSAEQNGKGTRKKQSLSWSCHRYRRYTRLKSMWGEHTEALKHYLLKSLNFGRSIDINKSIFKGEKNTDLNLIYMRLSFFFLKSAWMSRNWIQTICISRNEDICQRIKKWLSVCHRSTIVRLLIKKEMTSNWPGDCLSIGWMSFWTSSAAGHKYDYCLTGLYSDIIGFPPFERWQHTADYNNSL